MNSSRFTIFKRFSAHLKHEWRKIRTMNQNDTFKARFGSSNAEWKIKQYHCDIIYSTLIIMNNKTLYTHTKTKRCQPQPRLWCLDMLHFQFYNSENIYVVCIFSEFRASLSLFFNYIKSLPVSTCTRRELLRSHRLDLYKVGRSRLMDLPSKSALKYTKEKKRKKT